MATTEQKKNKLPRGYTRLKTLGEIVSCDVLVDQKDGTFAVMPVFGEDGITSCHKTLQEAENQIAAMQRENMVEVLYFNGYQSDYFPHFYVGKMRFVNGEWYTERGRRVDRNTILLIPNPDVLKAFEGFQSEYAAARKRMQDLRQSAIDLANLSLKLKPSE